MSWEVRRRALKLGAQTALQVRCAMQTSSRTPIAHCHRSAQAKKKVRRRRDDASAARPQHRRLRLHLRRADDDDCTDAEATTHRHHPVTRGAGVTNDECARAVSASTLTDTLARRPVAHIRSMSACVHSHHSPGVRVPSRTGTAAVRRARSRLTNSRRLATNTSACGNDSACNESMSSSTAAFVALFVNIACMSLSNEIEV
jgi:hypothetical protein